MPSDDGPVARIRPLAPEDRAAVARIVQVAGNFNPVEIECALELVDIYIRDRNQKDYRVLVAEDHQGCVRAYACWGPTPLTRGTYDLYWIATDPQVQGQGFGRSLMRHIEAGVNKESGRLLVIETSSKDSYRSAVEFYRRLGYQETSRIRDFYDVGDDKLVLEKRVPG